MPSLRGIGVSIMLNNDFKRLPEFPHADTSSSATFVLPDGQGSCRSQPGVPTDQVSSQTRTPTASVYIPSSPGRQFSVTYTLCQPEETETTHYLFKMMVNGQHITSWGASAKNGSSATVSGALYQPSERWQVEEDGMIHRQEGIESRSFFFSPSRGSNSIAEDGGLIEINAFRAKGRCRRAPRLEKHRSQGHYGILFPSCGLLEQPEKALFFDWDLIDPRDSPFVSFRFHYRCWENLYQLNLAPGPPMLD